MVSSWRCDGSAGTSEGGVTNMSHKTLLSVEEGEEAMSNDCDCVCVCVCK